MNKRILIISSEFPPMPGGIGNHAYLLAKELNAAGFDVTVLTEKREAEKGRWLEFAAANAELRIYGIPRRAVAYVTYLHRILKANLLIRENDWSSVIFSGKFPIWLNAVLPRTRSIAVVHGSEIVQHGIAKRLFARGLKRASRVVCVSEFTRRRLTDHYPDLESHRVSVVNNGIRNDWTGGKHSTPSTVELVTVGSMHKRKGQFNVVRALPRILKDFPETRYHVVGVPVEHERLQELVSRLDVCGHVFFHDVLDDLEVRNILESSDVFMLLSENLVNGDVEGFGIAAVEAMALGVPAIGSIHSGTADAIRDGHSGRLVDPANADEVAAALRDILTDYDRYSINAKEAAEHARWRYKVKEYRVLIDQLCAEAN